MNVTNSIDIAKLAGEITRAALNLVGSSRTSGYIADIRRDLAHIEEILLEAEKETK